MVCAAIGADTNRLNSDGCALTLFSVVSAALRCPAVPLMVVDAVRFVSAPETLTDEFVLPSAALNPEGRVPVSVVVPSNR
jgi:hypothetical protein